MTKGKTFPLHKAVSRKAEAVRSVRGDGVQEGFSEEEAWAVLTYSTGFVQVGTRLCVAPTLRGP